MQKGTGVNISARSMGEVNVQVVMEMLGGGGHLTMAGAQLKDTGIEQAEQLIRKAVAATGRSSARAPPRTRSNQFPAPGRGGIKERQSHESDPEAGREDHRQKRRDP